MTWNWIDTATVHAVHDAQLKRHGGLEGVRDNNAIESALNRAPNLGAYGDPPPDAADLAAQYIYGIAKNHGFSDGNKRTAWIIGRLFLADNGVNMKFNDVEAINFMLDVAGGRIDEAQTADWIRAHIAP